MNRHRYILAVILVLLAMPGIVAAQAIPLSGISLEVVPTSSDLDVELGSKTVRISKENNRLKIIWYSMVKDYDEVAEFPTYKVKAKRGIIETEGLDLKTAMFLPCLWGAGYIKAETALPLWIDPKYLELGSRDKRAFNPGLLNNNKFLLKLAPIELIDQLMFFQNLYDQYVTGFEVREDLKLSKSQEKELKKFVKDFFLVSKIAKTKATLKVNEVEESYPSRIIGNDYYQLVVIDDPLNPLVLSFKIFPDEAPKIFRKTFNNFKKNFEYQISQVHY